MTENDVLELKREIFKEFRWSLYDIDETDFFSLLEFVMVGPIEEDKNTRVIGGKVYKRLPKGEVPSWM